MSAFDGANAEFLEGYLVGVLLSTRNVKGLLVHTDGNLNAVIKSETCAVLWEAVGV